MQGIVIIGYAVACVTRRDVTRRRAIGAAYACDNSQRMT